MNERFSTNPVPSSSEGTGLHSLPIQCLQRMNVRFTTNSVPSEDERKMLRCSNKEINDTFSTTAVTSEDEWKIHYQHRRWMRFSATAVASDVWDSVPLQCLRKMREGFRTAETKRLMKDSALLQCTQLKTERFNTNAVPNERFIAIAVPSENDKLLWWKPSSIKAEPSKNSSDGWCCIRLITE